MNERRDGEREEVVSGRGKKEKIILIFFDVWINCHIINIIIII